MKQLFSMVALLAFTVTFAFAQVETVEAVSEEKVSGPKMEFETETVDYGLIEHASDPYRIFNFTNTGDEPLVISNARGSCGCTVPTYPTDPILPGESAEVKVRYDTKRTGKFTKYVTLTTNEVESSRRLMIKGEVEPKAVEEAVPTNDNMFGTGGGF